MESDSETIQSAAQARPQIIRAIAEAENEVEAQVTDRELKLQTIQGFVAFMTDHAAQPERIGRRVILIDFLLKPESCRETQKELAERLGISRAALNEALAHVETCLLGLKNPNSDGNGNLRGVELRQFE